MKKIKAFFTMLFVLLFFFSNNYNAHAQFEINWQFCYGEVMVDNAYCSLLVEDGYLVGGQRNHYPFLLKVDFEGNLVWEKLYYGENLEGGGVTHIIATSSGDINLVGLIKSIDGSNYTQFGVFKVDTQGEIIWVKTYGAATTTDHLTSAILTHDGGLVIGGSINGGGGDVSVYYGLRDAWIVKIDSLGNILWDFTMGSGSVEFTSAILETSDHKLLISVNNSHIYGETNINCDNTYWEGTLFMLDADGQELWQNCYGGTYRDVFNDIYELDDGFLLLGSSESNDGDLEGAGCHYTGPTEPTDDFWLSKIDFEGNMLWSKCYGGYNRDHGNQIIPYRNDEFLLIGNTQSHSGDVSGNNSFPGQYDIWIVKVNSIGELIWEQCFGDLGWDMLYSDVIPNGDKYFFPAAFPQGSGNSGMVYCGDGGPYYMWLFEATDITVGLSANSERPAFLSVVPDAYGQAMAFRRSSQQQEQGTINICDINGRFITSIPINSEAAVWDCSHISTGVYFYQYHCGKHSESGKVIVRR